MDVPENQHAAWEDSLFDAEGNPREQQQERGMSKFHIVPLPSCQKCSKPATDKIIGPYNDSYGVFCKKHAEERKKYLEK